MIVGANLQYDIVVVLPSSDKQDDNRFVTIVRLCLSEDVVDIDDGTLNHILGVWRDEVRMSLASPTQ